MNDQAHPWVAAVRRLARRLGTLTVSQHAAPLLVVAGVLGSLAGLISAAFWNAIAAISAIFAYNVVRPMDHLLPLPWTWASWGFLLPAIGGALVGVLAVRLFRTPTRLGVPAVMLDARREWGRIPLRYVPSTFVNAVLTIGSGGSAGREAPVVAMGGGLGAWLARRMGVPPVQRRLLVGCGAGAAIAAAFNAPLAGVFFALEIVLGDWRTGTLAPVMVASVAGTVVARAAEGSAEASHFQVPPYHIVSWWEPLIYAGLGIFAGIVAHLFSAALERSEAAFSRIKLPSWVVPALGGLGVGVIGLGAPGALGNGYPWVISACEGHLTWELLLILVFAKIVTTSLTLGSGGWGGDFAPTLFVGAMLGGVYGKLAGTVLAGSVAGSGAYAMVGMGAMLAAVIRCPVTAVMLLFELTNSYEVIVPIMLSVATATFVARRFTRLGLYHERLRELGGPAFEVRGSESIAHVRVGSVMREVGETFHEDDPYQDVVSRVAGSQQFVFPVLRTDGTVLGVIRLADLRAYLLETGAEIPVVAADLAIEEVPFVTVDTSADRAATMLGAAEWEELPVVYSDADRRVCGMISRHDVLRATLSTWASE